MSHDAPDASELDALRQTFDREPSQESGLALARAAKEHGLRAEALAVAKRALACEMDFWRSELGAWSIQHELEEIAARMEFPRESIEPYALEWRSTDGLVCGLQADGDSIRWFVRYETGRESGSVQSLSAFVARGPYRATSPPPRDAVRELARRLDAESRPWFAAQAGDPTP